MISVVRIIGNDLPPRHVEGQTLKNVRFILENEIGEFETRWVLNRIVDPELRRQLIGMLPNFSEIPINWEHYRTLTPEDRGHYLTDVNHARNFAVDLGLQHSEICIPLDGNCYFTDKGWKLFYKTAYHHPYHGYFAIPMARCKNYEDVGEPPVVYENWSFFNHRVMGLSEPQIAFTRNFDLYFNPKCPYGKQSKAELLINLGVPGVWSNWQSPTRKSKFFGEVLLAGYVYRLPSGVPEAESDNTIRNRLRLDGISNLVSRADKWTS